jgi:hypothetical protein
MGWLLVGSQDVSADAVVEEAVCTTETALAEHSSRLGDAMLGVLGVALTRPSHILTALGG